MAGTTKQYSAAVNIAKTLKARGARRYDAHDQKANVVDLLTDTMHFCAQRGIDFAAALGTAERHRAAEKPRTTTEG